MQPQAARGVRQLRQLAGAKAADGPAWVTRGRDSTCGVTDTAPAPETGLASECAAVICVRAGQTSNLSGYLARGRHGSSPLQEKGMSALCWPPPSRAPGHSGPEVRQPRVRRPEAHQRQRIAAVSMASWPGRGRGGARGVGGMGSRSTGGGTAARQPCLPGPPGSRSGPCTTRRRNEQRSQPLLAGPRLQCAAPRCFQSRLTACWPSAAAQSPTPNAATPPLALRAPTAAAVCGLSARAPRACWRSAARQSRAAAPVPRAPSDSGAAPPRRRPTATAPALEAHGLKLTRHLLRRRLVPGTARLRWRRRRAVAGHLEMAERRTKARCGTRASRASHLSSSCRRRDPS